MTRPVIGTIILISHDGRPTVWPVRRRGADDSEHLLETKDLIHLLETFETAKQTCGTELMEGGTLKLLDAENNLIQEQRGRVS
jgi:hypothetical protein|tara:strand:- start:214 stop:462 length:249 start_codon:yes stop_codon:yes gene_type:complete